MFFAKNTLTQDKTHLSISGVLFVTKKPSGKKLGPPTWLRREAGRSNFELGVQAKLLKKDRFFFWGGLGGEFFSQPSISHKECAKGATVGSLDAGITLNGSLKNGRFLLGGMNFGDFLDKLLNQCLILFFQ